MISSERALAGAIVRGAGQRGLALIEADSFEPVAGDGLEAMVGGRRLAVGNQRLLERHDVPLDGLAERAEQLAAEGKTVMYVAVDGRPAGVVAAADQLRPPPARRSRG